MQLEVIVLVTQFLFSQIDGPADLPVSKPLEADTLVVTKIRDLNPDEQMRLTGGEDAGLAVGFLYRRWPAALPAIWTTGGRYVVFHQSQSQGVNQLIVHNTYNELDDDQWRELLGNTPDQLFQSPLMYRVPLGLVLVSAAGLVGLQQFFSRWRTRRNTQLLSEDLQIKRSLEVIFPRDRGVYYSKIDSALLDRELVGLAYPGITMSRLRSAFLCLVRKECKRRNQALRHRLLEASDFAEQGRNEDSLTILDELKGSLLPDSAEDAPLLSQIEVIQQNAHNDGETWGQLWRNLTDRETASLSF